MRPVEGPERRPSLLGLLGSDESLQRIRDVALPLKLLDQGGQAVLQARSPDEVHPFHVASRGLLERKSRPTTGHGLLHQDDQVPWESAPGRRYGGELLGIVKA